MTTDELIGVLRNISLQQYPIIQDLMRQAADRLESIQAENAFLKAMQRQIADGVHDIGDMVENALKKEATANDHG